MGTFYRWRVGVDSREHWGFRAGKLWDRADACLLHQLQKATVDFSRYSRSLVDQPGQELDRIRSSLEHKECVFSVENPAGAVNRHSIPSFGTDIFYDPQGVLEDSFAAESSLSRSELGCGHGRCVGSGDALYARPASYLNKAQDSILFPGTRVGGKLYKDGLPPVGVDLP